MKLPLACIDATVVSIGGSGSCTVALMLVIGSSLVYRMVTAKLDVQTRWSERRPLWTIEAPTAPAVGAWV